jgi:hypothetical protein
MSYNLIFKTEVGNKKNTHLVDVQFLENENQISENMFFKQKLKQKQNAKQTKS